MMENESLREPKNTAVIFLALLVAATLVWAIIATVTASKTRKECDQLAQERDQANVQLEQVRVNAERQMAEVDKLRRTCLDWTRERQIQIQEEIKKKAEASKAAAIKTAKKPAVKTAAKVVSKKSTTAKRK